MKNQLLKTTTNNFKNRSRKLKKQKPISFTFAALNKTDVYPEDKRQGKNS